MPSLTSIRCSFLFRCLEMSQTVHNVITFARLFIYIRSIVKIILSEQFKRIYSGAQPQIQLLLLIIQLTFMKSESDEEIEITVEKPKEEQNKINSVIKDWEMNVIVEENKAFFYLVVSNIYLKNLINNRQKTKIPESSKAHISSDSLILQNFTLEKQKMFVGKQFSQNESTIKGNIHLAYTIYQGLTVNIYLGKGFIDDTYDHITAILNYQVSQNHTNMKRFTMIKKKENSDIFSFHIKAEDLDEFIKQNFILEIRVHKQAKYSSKFLGINNEGNTCYMNSILQILFFFKPFRKIIIESESKSNLIHSLRDLFIKLMDSDQHRSVDAEELIQKIGLFDTYPRRQQDIHEFITSFFQLISAQCPEIQSLWSGKGIYTTKGKSYHTPYESKHNDQFVELDIHMEDINRNPLRNIEQSLRQLLLQEKMDKLIETPEYGRIQVFKTRTFQYLPNILFLNIKRYEYNKKHKSLSKVLSSFTYPIKMNLNYLLGTPVGENCDYTLYAVTVHKGMTPFSGHYYSLINTSCSLSNPQWHEFNDSYVKESSEKISLSYSGKKKKEIVLHRQHSKYIQRQCESDQTAYLLVYIRDSVFQQYQNVKITIPKEYLELKRRKKYEEQNSQLTDVSILPFHLIDDSFDPFSGNIDIICPPLKMEEDINQQLKNKQAFLGCQVGSVWKVNKRTKKIKCIESTYNSRLKVTVSRIFNYRRGHQIPDYLIVINPEKTFANWLEDSVTLEGQQIGLLKIVEEQQHLDEKMSGSLEGNSAGVLYEVIQKNKLSQFITNLQQLKDKRVEFVSRRDEFEYGWNDYAEIRLVN